MNQPGPLQPEDLLAAAAACRFALEPALGRDWEAPARDLEWTCRRTLDHIVDVLVLYAAHLATRATERRPPLRNGDPSATAAQLLIDVESGAATLAEVVRAAPPGTRAFHPAGMADVTGFIAMGCSETLTHSWDIAEGLGVPFAPPDELAERIVTRLFPWAPASGSPWEALLWASGRIGLSDRDRLGPDWYWHCAPLAEWDGTPAKRTAPPTWR